MDENAEDIDQLAFTQALEQPLEVDVSQYRTSTTYSIRLLTFVTKSDDSDSALGSDT